MCQPGRHDCQRQGYLVVSKNSYQPRKLLAWNPHIVRSEIYFDVACNSCAGGMQAAIAILAAVAENEDLRAALQSQLEFKVLHYRQIAELERAASALLLKLDELRNR